MFRLFISFYGILLGCIFTYVLVGLFTEEKLAREWIELDMKHDYIGAFYIFETLHKKIEPEEFSVVVEQWPKSSNIPLELLSLSQLELSSEGIQQLRDGEIYIEDPDKQLLYYRLKESDQIVRLGPMSVYKPLKTVESVYEWMFFLVMGISSFFLLLFLHTKLKRLNIAASRFGEGDLSARVSEKGKHRVGNLNQTFNLMAERVEQLIQGHKNLTNAVAHELRTPIARMRFQLDMLHAEDNKESRAQYIYGMSEDLNDLSELIDELLTYARFEREAPSIDLQSHSLHESLQNVIYSRDVVNSIQLIYDHSWMLKSPSIQYMEFEPKHLERAIGNLVSNAQKYAKTTVRLKVTVYEGCCNIAVEDDGPGIPEEDRKKLFEPFQRLDDSRTRSTGGYGLGLAIVKQIAQWHSGTVAIDNSEIGGARFIFGWPVNRTISSN